MNSLPVQIYNDVTLADHGRREPGLGRRADARTLILLLNLIARLISRRSRLA